MNENLPIIVGVGQLVDHWDGQNAQDAPSPLQMIIDASKTALSDTGVADLAQHIDTMAVVRLFSDSLSKRFDPFGRVANYPNAVAQGIGATPAKAIYSSVGGEQPQALVNEFAASLFNGEMNMALITGGEAMGAFKAALKQRHKLNWASDVAGDAQDRGAQTDFISKYELSNGLGMPPQTYAAMEQALRARLGMDKAAYTKFISEIFEPFSQVAASNPYSQFKQSRSVEFLSTPAKKNYPVCDPYLKWHVAQDSVNQAAALIVTTVGFAKKLGIDESKWVYLHGHADAKDKLVSQRPDLSKSLAVELVLENALKASGLDTTQINHYEIYSCFPILVYLAAEALGLDVLKTKLTMTGGLPFFGGPGNNYSTHAIASMVETLRDNRQDHGLVLANGGYLSKESAGVYSCVAPSNWQPADKQALQTLIEQQPSPVLLGSDDDTAIKQPFWATIEAYTVRHGRGFIDHAFVVANSEQGRCIAKVNPEHRATMKALANAANPVGQRVQITHKDGQNYILNTQKIGDEMNTSDNSSNENDQLSLARTFEHIQVQRNGHILEITLNRPDSYNALFSAAHYELAEVFDAYDADQDLWVAIVTGAGEKAFCSGNDLKVTAKGGDMSIPASGFAGLCSRTNREKPVIAAVNGLAFGGGLEIVLACDLAIADEHAKFALPEVKVGLFAGAGGLQRLNKQIGAKAAMELVLTGRAISANEAQGLGIINSVSDSGGALAAARELAMSIVANSPSAIRASKRILNQVDEIDDFDEALKLSKPAFIKLLQTRDAKEGVRAFAEKRAPNWVNE